MRKALLVDLLCSFFILLFLYTALSKLWGYATFRAVLQKSPLLEEAASVVAWLLPAIEIGITTLLFIPRTRLAGLYCTLTILIIFTGYLSYMISVSPQLPCSCGGVLKQLTWRQHLLFNSTCIGLATVAISLYRSLQNQRAIKPGFPPRPPDRP